MVSLGRAWDGACEVEAEIDGRAAPVRALAYPHLVGAPRIGDRVLLNVTALEMGLGTGGYGLVVARPDALPADPPPAPGHLVKARYTPLQTTVLGVDEQDSPDHAVLRDADDLAGLPVVVADLHSALPAIVAGARAGAGAADSTPPRVVYVMTDGGALPAWFSRTVAALREAGWIEACVTVGQAFGGDVEAVSVHSGLLAAQHVLGADVVIVSQGPGNLGTGTRWGFSGTSAGEAINATGVLGGSSVAALRVSGADPRPRHQGISHHSLTAYGRVALVPADVVVPRFEDPALARVQELIDAQVGAVSGGGRHRVVDYAVGAAQERYLARCPVPLRTMGRSLVDDPTPFLAAAAAGEHAAALHMRTTAH